MSTKHTPGPWYVSLSDCAVPFVASEPLSAADFEDSALSEPAAIAFMERGDGRSFEEMLANACLFSAAPDLFKELSEAVANVERVTDGGRLANPELAAWLTRARAAIAKAKGGES